MNRNTRPVMHRVMDRAAEHLVPLQASLELTHRCNLACKHCYIDTHGGEELTLSEFKDVLDQLADAGAFYLMFTGGEPLVRKDFFQIAEYAKKKGFLTLLMTNGTLITPEIAGDIQSLEMLSIGMSLHGDCPETHDAVTGQEGSFNSTLNAVELLKSRGMNIVLQTLLMDANVHEAAGMKELANALGVSLKIGLQIVPTRSGSTAPYEYAASNESIIRYYESGLTGNDMDFCETGGPCKAGKGSCAITPTGDVFPCLLLPMKLGNLREARFDEIWRLNPCEELEQLRSITSNNFISCRKCESADYCSKCIGVFYSETGKLTEPAPSTCRIAALKKEFLNQKGVVA